MNSRISLAVAGMLAVASLAPAFAQTPPPAQGAANVAPSTIGAKPAPAYIDEPAASVSKTDGPNADVAKAIMDAINAEPSMKHAKLTVQPDENGITLTGVTLTRAQTQKAMELATSHAGEGKVGHAIQTEELVITGLEPPAA